MFRILHRIKLPASSKCSATFFKRFFLSESFKCTDAWENRLKSPVFKDINYGYIYSEFDKYFSIGYRISPLDVDLFANGMTTSYFKDELEDMLFKMRLNPETTIMYDSTSHAVIRLYLTLGRKDDLLNILSQRLSYGIFPDIYLSILMMDQFLKENDVLSAVKVGVLQMLQEDCDHPVLKTLAIYSCYKYLNSGSVWEVPPNEENEEEEELKVRVPFCRNEYFDDHFDIVNTTHLVGKTLVAFGRVIEGPIGISSQLLGFIMYDKLDAAKDFLKEISAKSIHVFKDAVDLATLHLKERGIEKGNTANSTSHAENNISLKAEIEELLLSITNNLVTENLEKEVEKIVKAEIDEHEANFIEKQQMLYRQWEKEREQNFKSEIMEREKNEAIKAIDTAKKELSDEEQHLFYFDNEHENENLVLENELKRKDVVYYKSKKRELKKIQKIIKPPLHDWAV